MISRFLLGALVVAALAVGASTFFGSSDVQCGPVQGTVPVSDGWVSSDLARVDAADARAAAVVAVPGAAVVDVDLDEEDGFLVYEVGLAHQHREFDVVVDAGTGEVLCTERD